MSLTKHRFLFGVFIVHFFCLYALAFQRWDPFDFSSMADVAWRLSNGQQMYTDFLFFTGPVTPVLVSILISVFGFSKNIFFAHVFWISSFMIFFTYFVFKPYLSKTLLRLTVILSAVTFYWARPFPTYTTDAYFFGILTLYLYLLRSVDINSSLFFGARGLMGFLTLVACFTNLPAGIMFFAAWCVFFLITIKPGELGAFVLGAGIAFILFAFLFDLGAYAQNTFGYYSAVSGRMSRFLNLLNYFKSPYFLFVLAGVFFFRRIGREPLILLILGGVSISWVSLMVSGSSHDAWKDLNAAPMVAPLFGMSAILFEKIRSTTGRELSVDLMKKGMILFGVLQITLSVSLSFLIPYQFIAKDVTSEVLFTGNTQQEYELKNKALRGWHVPPDWGRELDQVIVYLRENSEPEQKLLALSPWEVLYGILGRESYVPYPFHVFPFAHKETKAKDLALLNQNKPEWIVVHHHPRAPMGVVNRVTEIFGLNEWIFTNYALVKHWQYLALYRLKTG